VEPGQNAMSSNMWTSSENELFLNNRMSEELQNYYQKNFKEATYRNKITSHLGFLTSGTTVVDSRSYKIVLISKKAFLHSAEAINKYFLISSEDKWLQCLPRFHVGGMAVEARAHLAGFDLMKMSGHWNVEAFYNALISTKSTWSSLVPTQVYDLVQHSKQAPKKFKALVGGGRLSPMLLKSAKELGWNLIPTYGMTELASTVGLIENESIIKPLPHCQITISENKLAVYSKSLFSGYVQVVKGQVELVKPQIQGGFFVTDDVVQKMSQGIMLLGRGQDMVKISGELVSMNKLRDILFKVVGLENAPYFYLMAMPDIRMEHRIVLIVLKAESFRDRSVKSQFSLQPSWIEKIKSFQMEVMPFEKIKSLFYLDQIPRTDLGKVQERMIQQKIEKDKIQEVLLND
jgi:O-succinylbenzoic acid--CoA ligase